MKAAFASLVVIALFSSCAPSIPYSADYPMTQSVVRSRDGMFTGTIPAGWFSSTEDSLASALTVWLIKEDYSATLNVKELKLDNLTAQRVRHDGLKLLAGLNAALEHHTQQLREMKEFRLDGRSYCSYEFNNGELQGRAVVFTAKEKSYACLAQNVKGKWSKDELKNMFRAQQTLLSSLNF